MTSISRPIVFFGTEDFSAISLAQLLKHGFPIRLVITKPDSRRGRGKQLCQPAVKQLALTHDIPVLQPTKLRDIIPDIQALDQPVGVLVSFGKIIPQVVIDCFSPGIINLHPSLLPRYRGPSPIESAIANRDTTTGISIKRLIRTLRPLRQVTIQIAGQTITAQPHITPDTTAIIEKILGH